MLIVMCAGAAWKGLLAMHALCVGFRRITETYIQTDRWTWQHPCVSGCQPCCHRLTPLCQLNMVTLAVVLAFLVIVV